MGTLTCPVVTKTSIVIIDPCSRASDEHDIRAAAVQFRRSFFPTPRWLEYTCHHFLLPFLSSHPHDSPNNNDAVFVLPGLALRYLAFHSRRSYFDNL